ncbi:MULTISPECIES: slr1601 family putative cell division protein [Planktothrix]|uniref:Cell division protein FtsL n=1 Tax=Planktothrix mougeotii LEGE 06226 TaxID=1828728 RepID=A0ABR9UCJ0_9CYAN|nr:MULTISPECIES: hypothetical protein [Planktothrix]MBD2483202.1 hypothetical protein [Planktothrix sp. FACHB-1365]MBE9143536.1 hypothetical protein [Planktothrix mougeotii LEGE 06226]
MSATRPIPQTIPSASPFRRPRTRRISQQRRTQNRRLLTVETTVKLGVNLILSAFSISALIQMLPHHRSVSEKVQDIRAEVKMTEERVAKEREEFSRYFDPQQTQSIMQEQGNRIDPSQKPIIWIEPSPKEAAEVPDDSTTYAGLE